jgi:hypothetical protein
MLLGVLDIGSHSAQLQVFEARPGANSSRPSSPTSSSIGGVLALIIR